jgi:eukaryotic-like serine/threonine-protein kinase
MSRALPEREVEQSVRDRLYGEPADVRAIANPVRPRAGAPGRRALRPDPCGAGRLGHVVRGRYRLLERLGAGGMAIVYRARDELLKRDVAVKIMAERFARDPARVRRFRREAELGARVAHPNLVAILDAGVDPQDFIVMELVRGLDAWTLLEREGRLTPGEAVHLVAQVCEALSCLHDEDVLHNDVSLSNILISRPDGTAKLADFGLASHAGLDLVGRRRRKVTGTPGYIAPEVLRGAEPSPLSDLYSLGVVAYQLLAAPARLRPHDPDATAPLATAAPRMPPLAEARPGLPRTLTDAVQQALADGADARQDSVSQFRAQLVGALTASRGPRREMARLAELPSAA